MPLIEICVRDPEQCHKNNCTKKRFNNTTLCAYHLVSQRDYQKNYRLRKIRKGDTSSPVAVTNA